MWPELNVMILGLLGAIRAVFWGMVMLSMVLVTWAILAVQLIQPLNKEVAETGIYDDCDRCASFRDGSTSSADTVPTNYRR